MVEIIQGNDLIEFGNHSFPPSIMMSPASILSTNLPMTSSTGAPACTKIITCQKSKKLVLFRSCYEFRDREITLRGLFRDAVNSSIVRKPNTFRGNCSVADSSVARAMVLSTFNGHVSDCRILSSSPGSKRFPTETMKPLLARFSAKFWPMTASPYTPISDDML